MCKFAYTTYEKILIDLGADHLILEGEGGGGGGGPDIFSPPKCSEGFFFSGAAKP